MQEDTRQSGADEIEILEEVRPWENVRFRGEDLRRGSLALATGSELSPQAVAVVSALGKHRIEVHHSPVVAVISNGSELISPGLPLPSAGVYESNGLMLKALLERAGCRVRLVPPLADELSSVVSALRQALESADLVISVGGASVGELDLVRPAFETLGGVLDFWQLAMRPGKQFFFGLLQGKPLLGLPGNPVSAFVVGVLLVLPAVRRLAGARTAVPTSGLAPLGAAIQNHDRRRHFVRVRTDTEGRVFPCGAQASHFIHGLAHADGLVDMPPGVAWDAGQLVPVLRW
jgi:molybdopterin molybdotransferase